MEHRSSTNARHLTLFRTVAFAPHHVSPLSSNSDILVRLQLSRGLSLLRFPCGFRSRALLATCPSGLLSVWPIQPHARCFISTSIGHCSVCLQGSSFRILLGHQIRRMLLRHLLMNTCNFCFNSLVSLQVSAPYKSTAFTFDSKTLNLVLVVSAVDRHIGVSIANACLAFPVRAWMSSSVPPFLPLRHLNSFTFSICSPAIITPSSCLVPTRISFVFVALIFRPTFALCSSKACVLSFISCIL